MTPDARQATGPRGRRRAGTAVLVATLAAVAGGCSGGATEVVREVDMGRRLAEPPATTTPRPDWLEEDDEQAIGPLVIPAWPTQETYALCIVSHSTAAMRHYVDITRANHAAYARAHGYFYAHYEGLVGYDRFLDLEKDNLHRRYGLYWQSFAALEDAMGRRASSRDAPVCQRLMWVDADVVFTRFDTFVEERLEHSGVSVASMDRGEVSVVLSRQEWHWHQLVNAGVFVLQNDDGGRDFVHSVIDRFATHKDEGCPEQTAIEDWAFGTTASQVPPGTRKDFERAHQSLRQGVRVLPQRDMNGFHGYDPDEHGEAGRLRHTWHAGDFAAHFTGPKQLPDNAHRLDAMRELDRAARAKIGL